MKHALNSTLIAVAFTAAAFCIAGPGVAQAQSTATRNGPVAQIPANLRSQARIPEATARATALARVPTGQVVAAELEREGGNLLYSYDIKVPGKSGIQEVQVNAVNGRVIGVEHESPAAMAKEAAADRKAAKIARSHPPEKPDAGEDHKGN